MTEASDITKRLEAWADKVYPTANRFGRQEAIGRVIKLAQSVTVDDFQQIRAYVEGADMAQDDDTGWTKLAERLRRLSIRLEQDGFYVDASIVHQAFEALSEQARP